MGTVFVPRRPWRSLGSWARSTMSDTFYGLHFSKHCRRKEGALSAKYSRESLYGFLKRAQNRWSEKMLTFHCALCFAWFAWLKKTGKKMDSVSEPETIDNGRKQPEVCRKKFFPPFYLWQDRVWPGDCKIMSEGQAKRFPPLFFWVTPVLWECTAGRRKTHIKFTGFLECVKALTKFLVRYSPNSPTNDKVVTSFGLGLPKAKQSQYIFSWHVGCYCVPVQGSTHKFQVASVKKDVSYATQHLDLEGQLEAQLTSSPGWFHLWLAEGMTS